MHRLFVLVSGVPVACPNTCICMKPCLEIRHGLSYFNMLIISSVCTQKDLPWLKTSGYLCLLRKGFFWVLSELTVGDSHPISSLVHLESEGQAISMELSKSLRKSGSAILMYTRIFDNFLCWCLLDTDSGMGRSPLAQQKQQCPLCWGKLTPPTTWPQQIRQAKCSWLQWVLSASQVL